MLQSILFNKNIWTLQTAKRWLFDHSYRPIKSVDITANFYRFRINSPPISQNKRYYTKEMDDGVLFIMYE